MFIALSVLQGIICVVLYILSRPGDKLISLSAQSEWGIMIYHNKWFQILSSYVLPLTPPPPPPLPLPPCYIPCGGGGVTMFIYYFLGFMHTFLLMLHSVFTLVGEILCHRNGHYRYYYYLELTTKPYNQSWYGGIFSWAGVCCGKIGLLPSGSGW